MSRDSTRRTTELNNYQDPNLARTGPQPPTLPKELAREAAAAFGQELARELLQDERVRQAAKVGLAVGGITFGLTLLSSMARSGTQPTSPRTNYGK